jgi:glycerol-3-phosphate cytidylyltransferase-like family protein
MCDILVCGVNSDDDLFKTKGPTIMNAKERNEIIKHCKFVDEVIEDTPYSPSL